MLGPAAPRFSARCGIYSVAEKRVNRSCLGLRRLVFLRSAGFTAPLKRESTDYAWACGASLFCEMRDLQRRRKESQQIMLGPAAPRFSPKCGIYSAAEKRVNRSCLGLRRLAFLRDAGFTASPKRESTDHAWACGASFFSEVRDLQRC